MAFFMPQSQAQVFLNIIVGIYSFFKSLIKGLIPAASSVKRNQVLVIVGQTLKTKTRVYQPVTDFLG